MPRSTEPAPPHDPARRSGAKRVFLIAATALAAWGAIEALCFLALFFILGDGGYSPAALDAKRKSWVLAPETGQFTSADVEVLHPYLGYVYDPTVDNAELRQHHGGIPISDFGLLDQGLPLRPRSEDEIVVAIFGGSFAFNFSVYGLPGFLAELSAAPAFRGKQISIVRVALGGYKQPQQLLALAYLLALGAHFDVVINLDGFNEVALPATENVPSGAFPFFPRNWSLRVSQIPSHDARALMVRILDLRERRRAWAERFTGPPLAYSPAANLLWWARDHAFARASLRADVELARIGSPAESFAASGPKREYADEAALFEDLAALWFNASLEMQQLCAARGIDYWHFLQPNQYVAGSKPMSEQERKEALAPPQQYRRAVELGYPPLRRRGAELAAAGVRFHDLVDVFREHPEPLYEDSCCHANERGYAVVGQEMARRIVGDLAKTP